MKRKPLWPVPILYVIMLVWIIPVVGILVMSVRPSVEIMRGWWVMKPFTITIENYIKVWNRFNLGRALMASMAISISSTVIPIFLSSSAAYAFHFLNFPGRRMMLLVFINAFILPHQVLVIPLMKLWRLSGLMDNLISCVVPFVGLSFAWSIYYFKTFLNGFPTDLIDASRIDGCSQFRIYWNMVIPNTLTALASIGILQFIWTWNSLLFPLIFLRQNIPITVALTRAKGEYDPNWEQLSAGTVIAIAIPLLVFIVLQRYFTESVSRTGVEK